jgi:Mn-dependent DtxR family transcriptional regulator
VADLVSKFNVSERTVKENLKTLIDTELIEYKGSKKVGGYQITKKLQDILYKTAR